MGWRGLVKVLLAEILLRTGLLDRRLRKRLRGNGIVLMYHRVLPDAESGSTFSSDAIVISPRTFRRHLSWLRKRTEVLDLSSFQRWLANQADAGTERPASLVTFDDGWWDNADHALPALGEANISAVFFLAADFIGSDDVFWQERLGHLLGLVARRADEPAHRFLAEFGLTGATPSRTQIIDAVRAKKNADRDSIDALLERAGALAGDGESRAGVDRFMDWDAVQALQSAGQSVESHGCSHTPMPRLPDKALRRELTESAERLSTETGHRPRTLAYPNGDHDARVAEHAREAGYTLAFTTMPAPVEPGTDPMRIPRVNMDERGTRTEALFLCRLAGIF